MASQTMGEHSAPDPVDLGDEYFAQVSAILDVTIRSQAEQIHAAAALVADAVGDGLRIFIFGSGHSAIMGMEGHYRAGGLAAVTPILVPELMVHLGAIESTRLERVEGIGTHILERYEPVAGEVLIVYSTSGINNAPVEVAIAGREAGMSVIGVASLDYSNGLKARPGIPKLVDVVDVVLDNGAPAGDAVVEIPDSGLRCGPVSTVTGAVLLNMVLVSAVGRSLAAGGEGDVYRSANMSGAAEHNAALADRFREGNPHL